MVITGASAKPAAAIQVANDHTLSDDGSLELNDGVPIYTQDRVTDKDPFADQTTAQDTMTGATSRDVYKGIGVPMSGQTSEEVHHDGMHGRKRQPVGGGWMQPGEPSESWTRQ